MARGGPRSGSGRKRKAPEVKVAPVRAPTANLPAVTDDGASAPMIAPLHLSDLAQLIFRSIADLLEHQKRASNHYSEHVALLALRLEQVQRFQAVLESEGDTYTSKSVRKVDGETIVTTRIYARPEVTMLSDAMRQAQSLLGELMLNPSAALRIAQGHKVEENPFDF